MMEDVVVEHPTREVGSGAQCTNHSVNSMIMLTYAICKIKYRNFSNSTSSIAVPCDWLIAIQFEHFYLVAKTRIRNIKKQENQA